MPDYVVVDAGLGAVERSRALLARAERAGWTVSPLSGRVWLATSTAARPGVTNVGTWRLIGDVIHRRTPNSSAIRDDAPHVYERKLLARFWGRYVGVRLDPDGSLSALLRDPSGGLDCVTWSHDGLRLTASTPAAWLSDLIGYDWSIDDDRLTAALTDPFVLSGQSPLRGPVSVEPGVMRLLDQDTDIPLWTPEPHVRASASPWPSAEDAAERLRAAVEEAVEGLSSTTDRTACEVSGGLDSAIVTSCLHRLRPDDARLWLNGRGSTRESDERRHVAALERSLGISVRSVPLIDEPLGEAGLLPVATGWRPGLNGLDPAHDLAWASEVEGHGSSAIMTGKGGDSVLIQAATPSVFVDLQRAKGWSSLFSNDGLALARNNQVSLWTLAREARNYRATPSPNPTRGLDLFPPRHLPGRHPWLTGLEGFGPAKLAQTAGVIDNLGRHAPSLQSARIAVLDPLCAQPVMEACLALPAPLMTLGGRDRGLARHAFRDRLPPEIRDRRTKGDMTEIFGRRVAASLGFLRAWLLDGRLAARGLIDVEALDRRLDRDSLLWRGGYGEIIGAAAVEAWVRVWEARLAAPTPRPGS
jgi:asparagine synthase (glutamine-hydrolysing)